MRLGAFDRIVFGITELRGYDRMSSPKVNLFVCKETSTFSATEANIET